MSTRQLGVHSEIGTLRQAIVSRPGLAHRRLTPGNCRTLQFKEMIWVKQAQKDHDVLVDTLRKEGVEVLEHAELLTQTLEIAEARSWVLDYRLSPLDIGIGMLDDLRAWAEELPAWQLADYLTGGLMVDDLPFPPQGMFGSILGIEGFIFPPLPNLLLARDNSSWIYDSVVLCPMRLEARRPETLLSAAIYRFHPTFGQPTSVVWGDPLSDFRLATIEGSDVMPVGNGLVVIGMGKQTSPQAVGLVAVALFEQGLADHVVACQMPLSGHATHLGNVFSFCDDRIVTSSIRAADRIRCHHLLPGTNGVALDVRQDLRALFDVLADAMGLPFLQVIPTGGPDASEQAREQWNDGNNLLALRPGVVIGYDRNDDTNADLRVAGIDVLEIPGGELGRGRGGTRCLVCPTVRDPA